MEAVLEALAKATPAGAVVALEPMAETACTSRSCLTACG